MSEKFQSTERKISAETKKIILQLELCKLYQLDFRTFVRIKWGEKGKKGAPQKDFLCSFNNKMIIFF